MRRLLGRGLAVGPSSRLWTAWTAWTAEDGVITRLPQWTSGSLR